MLEAPKQDWELYDRCCREARIERLRSLSPSAALAVYEDLCRFAGVLSTCHEGRLTCDTRRWHEKVARRKLLHAAFIALDGLRDRRDGRLHPKDTR